MALFDTQFTGQYLIYEPEIPSTNRLAQELLAVRTLPEGTVIQAGHQPAGRGQQGSHWEVSPGQNLTLSVIYYPRQLPAAQLFRLSKAVALALRATAAYFLPGQEVLVKWPNDLLIGRRKAAGILIENQLAGAFLRHSIIGIGLNVNQTRFPAALESRATSLAQVAGHEFPLEGVRARLFQELEAHYLALRQGREAYLDQAYLQHLYGYQETVPLLVEGQRCELPVMGVDGRGRLVLEQGGKLSYHEMKTVTFLWEE
jgi:BirA family biotin operon repressor/biotin-[acetyl-CoA-carboxylase] ligase